MGRIIRAALWLLGGAAIAYIGLWVVAPPERVETDIAFDASLIPEDVDGWLADRESLVPNVDPDHSKRVLWDAGPGRRTGLALVYIHGFSATLWETRPLADRIAEDLGANLFYTRLTGHGRNGPAMLDASASAWIEDLAEAVAVGRILGDRVVLIGNSTGATLAALAAADPALAALRDDLAGLVLISPNFRLTHPAAFAMSMPGAEIGVPMMVGDLRGFEPQNDRHARHWTTPYPTVAALPVQALIDHAEDLDFAATDIPALFYFSPDDRVVDARATEAVAARWGGPKTIARIDLPDGDDPDHHVIAGDILSPQHTPEAIGAIGQWISELPDLSADRASR
ncbi:MAG: alpha/beta fold hydrolase [Pseudomonadota bacterium]